MYTLSMYDIHYMYTLTAYIAMYANVYIWCMSYIGIHYIIQYVYTICIHCHTSAAYMVCLCRPTSFLVAVFRPMCTSFEVHMCVCTRLHLYIHMCVCVHEIFFDPYAPLALICVCVCAIHSELKGILNLAETGGSSVYEC